MVSISVSCPTLIYLFRDYSKIKFQERDSFHEIMQTYRDETTISLTAPSGGGAGARVAQTAAQRCAQYEELNERYKQRINQLESDLEKKMKEAEDLRKEMVRITGLFEIFLLFKIINIAQ